MVSVVVTRESAVLNGTDKPRLGCDAAAVPKVVGYVGMDVAMDVAWTLQLMLHGNFNGCCMDVAMKVAWTFQLMLHGRCNGC